jgi:FkbM family methyltransferase
VHTYELALSDRKGTAEFTISEMKQNPGVPSASGSLLEPQDHIKYDNMVVFPTKITVSLSTVDLWAAENGISNIDFMWLDLQGHELTMLKNSKAILPGVKLIYMEVEFVEAYKNQPLYWDIKSWLEEQGFEVIALDFEESHARLGNQIPFNEQYCGNVVFINKAYKERLSSELKIESKGLNEEFDAVSCNEHL